LHCPNASSNLFFFFFFFDRYASSNLLSIQKFYKDNNCYFILISSSFVIKDMLNKEVFLQGLSRAGLYLIFLQQFCSNKASCKATSSFTASIGVTAAINVWHLQLVHPLTPVLQQLLQKSFLTVTDPTKIQTLCEPCNLSKSKKLPFLASSHVSYGPLELIHSDVWASPVMSIGGCKFYVVFIDDRSHFAWMYPLKQKSNVLLCFMKFKVLVENLFSCKIKQFQTDNGG
jgi:hypothetical protein